MDRSTYNAIIPSKHARVARNGRDQIGFKDFKDSRFYSSNTQLYRI